MSADPADLVGTVIAERFEVVRVIGRGSHGAVCEVVDRSTGLPAALKMLLGQDPDLAGRLEREAKALAMLAHPNIVALVAAGYNLDGTPYLATELIRGVSLRDVLDAGALAPRRALGIVRQLLEALDHAHTAGMIHRDIKPDNIMLVDERSESTAGGQPRRDYVKLLDFGVAKAIDLNSAALGTERLTRAGLEVLGSPPYIAPETALGEPLDARTDVYSVGIVLFEMLSGHVPFQHDEPATLLRKHVTDPVPPLRVAVRDATPTAELEAIVVRALAKLADDRFPSAIAMHAAVASVAHVPEVHAAGTPSSAVRAGGLGERARHGARELVAATRRHPRRLAAIATAVAVALVIVVIANGRGSDANQDTPVAAVAAGAPAATTTPRQWIDRADSELARRRYGRAIAAYERALAADRTLARDGKLRAAVSQIASASDVVAAVIALDVLASRLDPPDRTTILDQASTGRLAEVRRRAFAIAERDGFAQSIDRFASWTLDLKQQASCEERRDTIAKLRDLGDPRAVDALQRASTQACVAKDATAAITVLQAATQRQTTP